MQVARRSVFAVCAILQSYNILYFYDTVGKMKAFKKAPTVAVTTPLLWHVYDKKKNKDFDQFSWLSASGFFFICNTSGHIEKQHHDSCLLNFSEWTCFVMTLGLSIR